MKSKSDRRSEEPFGDTSKLALAEALKNFNEEFPTEDVCLKELYRLATGHSVEWCNSCNKNEMEFKFSCRSGKCKNCSVEVWYTANTFFDHIKRPRAWLFPIILMEKGIPFSAGDISRCMDVCISTGWTITKKYCLVLSEQLESRSTAITTTSSDFADIISKRSIETPARQHPTIEEIEMEKQSDLAKQKKNGTGGRFQGPSLQDLNALSTIELEIFNYLCDEPTRFEELYKAVKVPIGNVLSSLTNLELAGLIDRLPGDCLRRTTAGRNSLMRKSHNQYSKNTSKKAKVIFDSAIAFIRKIHYGCSRKYLQLFLALHSCLVDKTQKSFRAMLAALGNYIETPDAIIRSYVTPLIVRL